MLSFHLKSQFCGSFSASEPATVPLICTVTVLRPVLMFLTQFQCYGGGGGGVSAHTQRPQELEQDGSPFTATGGRDFFWGGGVKSQIFTAAWCPVSATGPVGSSLSSHWMFPYLTPPPRELTQHCITGVQKC